MLNSITSVHYLSKFTPISNVYIYSYLKKKTSSASGVYSFIVFFFFLIKLAVLHLPSHKKIIIKIQTKCIYGRQSNIFKKYIKNGKASTIFLLKKRPKVRGVAKNPVDHPHGGRTKSVQPEVSPWGWITKHNH